MGWVMFDLASPRSQHLFSKARLAADIFRILFAGFRETDVKDDQL
jgi:hypothetical protein